MLSNIITKVNRRILKILLAEKASLSEIARKSKTTKANIFNSLKKLEQEDLVRKEIRGRTHLYRFNHLHSQAKELSRFFLEERKKEYNQKMEGLPALLNSLLKQIFKEKYQGCIFFGSSLEGKYQDIDVFVMIKGDFPRKALRKEIKEIHEKISLVFGIKKELELGIQAEDMLYKNIIKGLPFNCEEFISELRQKKAILRREDIQERFIIGYREILSCLEFTEKEYVKRHLEKGINDLMYAALNYFDLFPENDYQAREMFKKKFGFLFLNQALKAKEQAEKIGAKIL